MTMSGRVLRFDQKGVKAAMRHPLLHGKKPIARGMFSLIYDGSRHNRVLKMTIDDAGYRMLTDPYAVKHRHFPKVHTVHGQIGVADVLDKPRPIFLFEMERLEKIKPGSETRKLARLLTNVVGASTKLIPKMHWTDERHTWMSIEKMREDPKLPKSLKTALGQLAHFCKNVPIGTLDMHLGNFMQRANGDLVLTDPIANMRMYCEAQEQLRLRGW